MKKIISLGLAVVLVCVFAHPAISHQLDSKDPEPDYVLYGLAVILYPIGDIVNHLLFGPHEKDESTSEASEEQKTKKPKYNFSARKKHPQEKEEVSP